MARQYVRFAQVRTPEATADTFTSSQVQSAEVDSSNAEEFLQYVLSQIRLLAGTQSWKDLPQQTVAQLGGSVQDLQASAAEVTLLQQALATLSATVAQDPATYATKTALSSTASSLNVQIAGLRASVAQIGQLAQAVQNLSTTVAQVPSTYATQTALTSTATALNGQIGAVQTTLSGVQAQIASLVTPQGLQNALRTCTLFDQPLRGAQNRANRIFVTPLKYVLGTLRVFCNGQRLYPGPLNDYVAAESAQGLGYDTVILTQAQAAPNFRDLLTADFIPS